MYSLYYITTFYIKHIKHMVHVLNNNFNKFKPSH